MATPRTSPHPTRHAPRRLGGRSWLAAAALGLLTIVGARPAAAHGDGSYPRTVCLDWRNYINAPLDSRYDVLVHSERITNDQLDSLRTFNPSIKRVSHTAWYVYYYAGPSGYEAEWGPFSASDPKFGFERRYWDLLQDNGWWMYAVDSSGTRYHASMSYQAWCGNFTSKCPRNSRGQRLCDVYADFLVDNLVAQRHIEGVLWDYTNDYIGWMNWYMPGACKPGTDWSDPATPKTPATKLGTAFDADCDGVPDQGDSLNAWWAAGINVIMNRMRERLGDSFLLLGNGQHHFRQMNGVMIERFPYILGSTDPIPNPYGYKWQANMFSTQFGYLNGYEALFSEPHLNIIDASSSALSAYEPDRSPERERFKRYTLGSALLGDGYYGIRGPGLGYVFWEPEFDLRLGWPTGPATSYVTAGGLTLWTRDFQYGKVWINPTGYGASAEAGGNPVLYPYDASITQTVPLDAGAPAVSGVRLESPWPNPTAGASTLRFALAAGAPGTLQIYDVRGRLVREVWSGVGTGAVQTAVWDGASDFGTDAPAGMYLAALFADGRRLEQRLVRLR